MIAQKAHGFVQSRRELGLAPKTGVPSNTHAPSSVAHNHMAMRLEK
jgi:hypothetical protein